MPNGKSAALFLAPGGLGVDPANRQTFSALFKQLSKGEVALLPSTYPALARHYARPGGSLLAPLLGWVTYAPVQGAADAGAARFDAMLMENVAR